MPTTTYDPAVRAFLDDIHGRVLVFDGAMGTNLQTQGLTVDDFGGLEGCSEALLLFKPAAVRKVHADFLRAGCRAVETNTFGATRIVLREYGLENRVAEINKIAVKTAREAMEEAPGNGPRYVAGSMGPSSRLPTLGQIPFDEMTAAYREQVEALWEAGADLFLVETCQDLLQTKSALTALAAHFRRVGSRRPVMVSVTLEAAGTMLLGSDIAAVSTILEPFGMIDSIGINCATGPLEMVRHVEYLSKNWNKIISVMPNAGLPENVGGKPVYRLSPDELAAFHKRFVQECGINIAGGCCGTSPAHLAAVAKAVGNLAPAPRRNRLMASAASLYTSTSLVQEPAPCLIGERTNANGSRAFRDLLLKEDWDGMTAVGRDQARGGAHILDLSVAYVGRDEKRDMEHLAGMFATQVKLPLMIDSTDPKVVEAALKKHPGRCIINSVNLEDGGDKAREMAVLARDFGALLICLTIDEEGMAKTTVRKLEVAKRLHDLLTGECGLRSCDLIFDTLTFTLGSGDAELRTAALETLDAIDEVRKAFPDCHTLLGVSNISFGLAPEAREVLNSVFLDEAVKRGLQLAIVNPRGIRPTFKIHPESRRLALELINNVRGDGSELNVFIKAFAGETKQAVRSDVAVTPEEGLRRKVLDGDRTGLDELLTKLRERVAPLAIINEHLIPAMKEVGQLFGAGQMQLPFVLQSAEVMKTAVNLLEPYMEKREADPDRRIVLATVRGDVHDIGKNLVNILLSNNGFSVIDLGIKVDIDTMIKAAKEQNARVIGMSGLLVKSTQVMKENLEELNRRGFLPQVVLGGAALTRSFVEDDLRALYHGEVHYASDAFAGLQVMQQVIEGRAADKARNESRQACLGDGGSEAGMTVSFAGTSFPPAEHIPEPPFWGVRQKTLDLDEVLPFLDRETLFKFRWQYRRGSLDQTTYQRILHDEVEPALQRVIGQARSQNLYDLKVSYGFFKARRKGDALEVGVPQQRPAATWTFPRQKKSPGLCLADFFAADRDDVIGLWSATIGPRAGEAARALYEKGDYREYLHLHGLGVEVAEALAGWLEQRMSEELGLLQPPRQRAGLRFSFGFPACPSLTDQEGLLKMVEADKMGLSVTDLGQMVPEESVSGLLIHHPAARYFVP